MFTVSNYVEHLGIFPFPFPIIFQRGLLSDSWDRKSALRDNGHRRKRRQQRRSGNLPDGSGFNMCRGRSMMRIKKTLHVNVIYIYIQQCVEKETLFDENV